MFKIVEKSQYSEKVYKLVVEAPLIAKSRRAGHFVIIRTDAQGERIPLTIAEADARRGTITLVVQAVGLSSAKLTQMQVGDSLADIVGPLGRATHIENFGTVVCAGGGVGVAPMLPIVQALKAAGNRVIVVLAGRTKELIIMEEEMRQSSDEVIIMTDDGSYGSKGLVTQGIEQVIQREKVDKCFAIGPAIMMKFCCLLTKKYNIPTDVSLNTIMVDGTGMCGACRVTVGGKTKFVCVDGPEFDGHEVDFDKMMQRLGAFKSEEREAFEAWEKAQADSAATASTASEDEEKCMGSSCETLTAPIGIAPEGEGRDAAWRVELRSAMKPKERMAVARQEMAELDAATRSHELREEVQRGLTGQQAMTEATRCLDCANPGCVTGCPVGIDIPAFVKLIEKGAFVAAARSIKKQSSLPAVCGRVCPQEKQCESRCIHLKTGGKPVAIGYLERFAADQERLAALNGNVQPQTETHEPTTAKKQKVAIVGSGPAGLTCAGDLARRGYSVTVFEALHELGGVLKYGIPEYRLPNDIVDFEIENLRTQGVEFVKDCIVGKTITVEQLQAEGYSAIFVGSGAGLPNFMGIPGENATGILSSNEYLTRVNLMDASNPNADTPVPFAKRVAVVGGGNTAMDSVRTARRLGAEEAFIIYRRSEQEMPARLEEVRHAKEEGVKFLTLCNPLEYISDEQGHVHQVVLQKMQLGEPDASGRRRPEPIPGATETLDVDLVIVAIGVSPNPIVPASLPALEQGRKGTIAVNDDMQSNIPTLFAGGDIVRGGATVILAMGDGKHAAESIDKMLSGEQE